MFWQKCRLKDIGYEPNMMHIKACVHTLCSSGLVRLEPAGQLSVETRLVPLFTDEDFQIALNQ